jgi:hypothetical protein
MFFLGEYSNMIIMSSLITILFCGGWSNNIFSDVVLWSSAIFICKILVFCYLYILIRASLPRYRYDQLMNIGWKSFLPIALCFLWTILILNLNLNTNIYQYEILNGINLILNNFLFTDNIFLINQSEIFWIDRQDFGYWKWLFIITINSYHDENYAEW